MRQDLERTQQDLSGRLAGIENEGRAKIAEAIEKGEETVREILEEAHVESRRMIEKAKEEIEREKKKALLEMKEHVADLSIRIASKVVQQSLKRDEHQQLILDSLAEATKEHGQN